MKYERLHESNQLIEINRRLLRESASLEAVQVVKSSPGQRKRKTEEPPAAPSYINIADGEVARPAPTVTEGPVKAARRDTQVALRRAEDKAEGLQPRPADAAESAVAQTGAEFDDWYKSSFMHGFLWELNSLRTAEQDVQPKLIFACITATQSSFSSAEKAISVLAGDVLPNLTDTNNRMWL